MFKKISLFMAIFLLLITNVFAKQVIIEDNMESVIMLDAARRYYTVDEIKEYIDALAQNKNATLQIHFTDDENVGIECNLLDQTVANATYSNGIYTNPDTGKNFLSYNQVKELMNYAKEKNVEFIPEIDVPAHMKGFITLAEIKYGYDYVHTRYNWDNPELSGIAWGTGDEVGQIDLMSPTAIKFIKDLYDEYTEFFKDLKYFHIGFDEYTFRPELKVEYINKITNYLINKGFTVRMWSDAITKTNINDINNKIEITYWGYKDTDILPTEYATVPDLQDAGFKILISNKYYLFFVPNINNIDDYSLNYTIDKIDNEWELENWNYNFIGGLANHDNILGGMVCNWGENSLGVDTSLITIQTIKMYNAMFKKLDKWQTIIDIPDDTTNNNNTTLETNDGEVLGAQASNPNTIDNILKYASLLLISLVGIICILFKKINV